MHEKDLHACQSQYETVQKQFNVTKGLFQTRFCNVMDEMKLQRQVYHSGALVGNDVNKLTKNENITKISRVFTPSLVKVSDGSDKEFSSSDKAVKMRTLLTKFKQCYDLYSVL